MVFTIIIDFLDRTKFNIYILYLHQLLKNKIITIQTIQKYRPHTIYCWRISGTNDWKAWLTKRFHFN